jgi:hypothetical protein
MKYEFFKGKTEKSVIIPRAKSTAIYDMCQWCAENDLFMKWTGVDPQIRNPKNDHEGCFENVHMTFSDENSSIVFVLHWSGKDI